MQTKSKHILKISLLTTGSLVLLYLLFGISVSIYFLNASLKRPSKGWTDPLVDGDFGYREQFKSKIYESAEWLHSLEHEDIYIKSFDGLKLHGKYYEQDKNAPTVIMMHGYHSSADFEFSGIYEFFYNEKNGTFFYVTSEPTEKVKENFFHSVKKKTKTVLNGLNS